MTKAMVEYFDEYKDASPGANGWDIKRQVFDQVFLPYHEGALQYYKEAGIWKPEYQTVHERNLKRQDVLAKAWTTYSEKAADSEDAAINEGRTEERRVGKECVRTGRAGRPWE